MAEENVTGIGLSVAISFLPIVFGLSLINGPSLSIVSLHHPAAVLGEVVGVRLPLNSGLL